MPEQEKKTPVNGPVCACGREELLTPATPQPANTGAEDHRPTDERPGPLSTTITVAAGPVTPQTQGDN